MKEIEDKELVELEAEDLQIVSVLRDGNKRDTDFEDLLEEGGVDRGITYFHITDTGEKSIREDERHKRFYEDPSLAEGGITIRPPSSIPWPVAGTVIAAVASILFNMASVYTRQGSFNEDVTQRVENLKEDVREIQRNTYTRKEVDLQLDTQKAELKRLDDLTKMLKEDVDHIEREWRRQ